MTPSKDSGMRDEYAAYWAQDAQKERQRLAASLSPAAWAFVQAYEALCRQYGLALVASGYDSLVLTPLDPVSWGWFLRGLEGDETGDADDAA